MAQTPENTGSTIQNNYYQMQEDVCPVPKSAILDNSASAREEIWQFSLGGFMFSGSFWLGAERLYTEGATDPLLWICGACAVCGGLLAITGFRQAARRVSRLEKYIPKDKS